MVAILNGRTGIVRLLLEYGADVNVIDVYNNTALMLANESRAPEIVELLTTPRPKCMSIEEYNRCDKNEEGKVIDPLLLEPVVRKDAVKLEGQPKICYNRASLKRWTKTRKTNPVTNETISDVWIRSNLGELSCEEPPTTGGKYWRKPIKKRKTKTKKSNKKHKKVTRKTKRK
jgi:hypothetical protein